jgi:hypothetical protein
MNELMHQSGRSLPPPPSTPDAAEEDGAVLRAVRAFLRDDDVIGALDSDEEESRLAPFPRDTSSANDSSGSATEAPTRKAATKYPPARPRMVNRSRVRMQNEIFSLRQKSIALERRLAELQREGSDAATATTDSTTGTAAASTSWQAKALEQRERVEAAEREREELRKKVNDCKKAMRSVRQYLRRQIKKQSAAVKTVSLGMSRQTAVHLGGPMDYEDLSEYLDSMYAKLDSVFQYEELDSVIRVTDELNKMRIQNKDSLNMSLEFVRSRVLPFDVATTARAMWSYHVARAGNPAVQVEQGSRDTEDMLRRSYVSYISFPHFKGHVHGRWEARRFVDEDRVIILHCSIFHRIEGSGVFQGMGVLGVRMLNWTVISPPRDERVRTAPALPASHIDNLEIITPFIPNGDHTNRLSAKQREEIKKFFVVSVECVHTLERQALENILLSGAK